MEKEKKGSFLGRIFSKNKSDEKGVNGSTKESKQQSSTQSQDNNVESTTLELPVHGDLPSPGEQTPGETKKRSFGSWRLKKRRSWTSISTSPISSPSESSDKSFEIPDGEQDLRPYSMCLTSSQELEVTQSNDDEPSLISHEFTDKSKAQATESPKKDTARKPVLGKIGIFFNTGKKKPIRSFSESPTSPTGPSSRSNEKETPSERRRTQVASPTDSKTPNLPSPVGRVERRLSDSQSKKENSNGESNNGLHSDGNRSVKETETPITSASGSTIKPFPSPSAKYFVKPAVPSPGRRLEGESSKITSRKLQVFSQEINIREDSPKITPKKSTKFSGKSSDSKPKGPDKPVQASDNTVASSPTKLTLQAASQSNTKEQTSLSPVLSKPGETADKEVTGDISPGESSPVKNILSGSPQERPKANGSNENANNPKVLTFDIYLSKQSESGSPASQEGYSNGESMESSPGYRRSGKKRRSLKSQSSQNGEKKADCISPQEQGLDSNFSFEGVTESPTTPEQKTKPGPLSPEAPSVVSANQDAKAGANRKLSPKGESDKDKQQHPASSHLRKKKENQSASAVPASPTARKVQPKDSLFRNPSAAAVRAAEGNQTVSTTKDPSSEKQTTPGSLSGNYGEDCVERSCELTEESLSPAAGALPEDKQQGSNQGVPNCPLPAKAEAVIPTTPSPVSSDVSALKTSEKENARSTVTSKLHLPPKPKNVELSIKPKFSENIESSQELTSGPIIQKGSIASKISIFENKTTTHKQIDFLATKNLSQPKKFVERAKLNLGKQPKKIVHKPFSSQARLSSDLKPTGTIKSENSSLEIKEEDTSPTVFGKSKVQPTETNIESVERQMDDTKHGLDTVVVPSDDKGVLSPHSTESPKEYLPTEQSFIPDVTSNSRNKTSESPKEILLTEKSVPTEVTVHGEIKSNEQLTAVNSSKSILLPTVDTKDHLLPIVETSTPHTYSTASELDSKILQDMGNVNKNNSMRRKAGLVESEVSSTVSTDSVDSSFPATLSHATEKIELNNSEDFSRVQTELQSIKFVPEEDQSMTCESKVIRESQPTETVSINEQIPDAIQAMDISPSYSGKESSVEEIHEALKHTSLHEVDPTRSHVEDIKVKQEPHIVTDSQDDQYSNGKRTGSSPPPVPVGITENIEEIRSADNGQVSVDQRISDFGRGTVVSVVENTSTPEEENHLSISDSRESAQERDKTIHNQENSPHVSTSVRASVVTSDGSHMDSLAKKYDADPKTNEIISTDLDNEGLNISHQKPQNTVLQNGVEIKAGVSQLNGNESESERCSSLENVENIAKPIRDPQIVQHEKRECVERQDMNVVRECEGVPEDCASTSNVTPQSVDAKELPSEGDRIDVDMGQPLADYAKQNGYVSEVIQSNGSPEKSLNVEQHFKGLQGTPEINLNVSVASDENNLDSSSDMEKFAETIRKLESPVPLTQKRKKPRAPKSPGPYYGLPPIREDFLEKILDGDTFSFGLGKKERAIDMAPMALFKLQSRETAEKMLPKRASAEQSMLLKSLKSTREPFSAPQEASDKETTEGTALAVKRSRIDSMYSGLKSSSIARSEDDVFSPSVTTVSTITTSFATPQQECAQTGKNFEPKMTDSATTAQPRVNETEKDFIHANGSCVQGTVNSLQADSSKQSQSTPQGSSTTTEKQMEKHTVSLASTQLSELKLRDREDSLPYGNGMALPPLQSTPKLDPAKGDNVPNDTPDIFYFKGRDQNSLVPTLVPEGFPGQGVDKINPRPGKVVILTESDGEGAVLEVCNDVADCTSWELTPTVCIKTIRGCWILHEFPNFQGRSIALEEGDLELSNPWGEELQEDSVLSPVVIGSLRHVVKDYRVCQIDLFTEPDGLGIMTSYFDDTEELQVYGKLQRTCSIKVHWGVWLIYEEPGFQGMPYIIEPGEYPNLSFWDAHEAFIGSMRPLKMGSRKVEVPYDPKIIIFEKPLFEGRHAEVDKEILKLEDLGIQEAEEAVLPFSTVGSMRVLSGLWVGYEKPGFDGHQYLLEEGDYEEWTQWAGFNDLLRSLRPILSDFSTPQMTMYSDKDFDEKGPNINVLGIISNMEETGYGLKTQSINVVSGVWVVYETPDFTGEQYILEKGMYRNFSDWGAKNAKISSVQPIILDTVENPRGSFKVELFSEPDFQGQVQIFECDTKEIEASFTAMSCKVISGRWAAYEKDNFKGSLWVLEEGCFPNLFSMGCQRDTVIRSLQVINYEFSEPAIILYGKENFQGRKVKLVSETMSILATGYSPDLVSLEVLGGIWVLYEYSNYRGRQIFIKPGKIAQWNQFSGWERIGSLRPLRQKRLYFKIRNKSSGMLMSTNGTLDDIKLLRIQVMEDTGAEDQIWVYHEGTFRCRIAEDCRLATSGSLVTAGSKLGLTLEQTGASTHWNINPDGRIYSRSKPNLVLDIKGGNQYDQQHVILSQVTEGKQTQLWEICIL